MSVEAVGRAGCTGRGLSSVRSLCLRLDAESSQLPAQRLCPDVRMLLPQHLEGDIDPSVRAMHEVHPPANAITAAMPAQVAEAHAAHLLPAADAARARLLGSVCQSSPSTCFLEPMLTQPNVRNPILSIIDVKSGVRLLQKSLVQSSIASSLPLRRSSQYEAPTPLGRRWSRWLPARSGRDTAPDARHAPRHCPSRHG